MSSSISISKTPFSILTGFAAVGLTVLLAKKVAASKRSSKPPPENICVYGWIPLGKDPDSSPACIKLVTYLKMVGVKYDYIPFVSHQCKNAPKGKVPYVNGGQEFGGAFMGDSNFIISHLVSTNPDKYNLDTHLTKEEQATGVFLQAMVEESLYWACIEVRWSNPNFEEHTFPLYFSFAPYLLRRLVANMIRKKILRDYKGQGTGLHSDTEVLEKFVREIKALSVFLGDKKYLMGDRVSSFDASVYGHLAVMMQGGWDHPIISIVKECDNLVSYVERMRREYWPELQNEMNCESQ